MMPDILGHEVLRAGEVAFVARKTPLGICTLCCFPSSRGMHIEIGLAWGGIEVEAKSLERHLLWGEGRQFLYQNPSLRLAMHEA
jgi:hypothetical protein